MALPSFRVAGSILPPEGTGFQRAFPLRTTQRIHYFGGLNPRHFPEKPSFIFISQISELNEVFRGRLQQATFPARNRHGRTVHASRQLSSIDRYSFAHGGDMESPSRTAVRLDMFFIEASKIFQCEQICVLNCLAVGLRRLWQSASVRQTYASDARERRMVEAGVSVLT